ncbi:MAG: hypothetical protein AABY22_31325 [Nanoarchaeota archaeon]
MEKELDNNLIQSFVENSKEIQIIEEKISSVVANFKKELEEKNKQLENIRESIKVAMRDSDVKKFENDVISLTYVAPTTRKSIDTDKLKEEKPELWEEYSKVSEVKDSIRIKIK